LTVLAIAATAVLTAVAAGPSRAAVAQDGEDDAPTLLFVQDAKRGTFVPGPKPGQYRLTLYGVPKHSLWFENRPGDRKGTIPNGLMLGGLFKPPVVPPNAAIDAWDPRRGEDVVMGVKILSGKWLPKRNVMRYRVKKLRNAAGSRSDRRTNSTLPRRFGEAAVFLDDQFGRNVCESRLQNSTGATLTVDRNGTFAEPGGFARIGRPPDSMFSGIGTGSSAFGRAFGDTFQGCYTRMTYKGPRGTVTLGLDVPYFGSNSWACTTTGSYKCAGPKIPGSQPYGTDVYVQYEVW
jgi:hypothetical protein